MHRRSVAFCVLAILMAALAWAQRPVAENPAAEKPWPSIGFEQILDTPPFFAGMKKQVPPDNDSDQGGTFLFITNAGDGSNRLYLVERHGRIWILENGKLWPQPLLDISSLVRVDSNSERGLLSMAFPPDYKTRREFYVFYTSNDTDSNRLGDLILERFKVDPQDPHRVVENSGEIVMSIHHPVFSNHNGGQIAFGPDGLLYWALGDGGGSNDMNNYAQNLNSYFGKMLRIDVEGKPDEGRKYHVPADNPFVHNPNAKPEIWALGLRNPFRFSFDAGTGDLYIGNVGQEKWESIFFQPAASKGGENYGWSIYEGSHALEAVGGGPVLGKPPQQPGAPVITFPIAEFSHPDMGPDEFKCLIGGNVYRGAEFPGWDGIYFFSDWISGKIFALRRNADGKWESHDVDGSRNPALGVVSFGTDEKGNLYICSFSDGKVYKLIELPPATQ